MKFSCYFLRNFPIICKHDMFSISNIYIFLQFAILFINKFCFIFSVQITYSLSFIITCELLSFKFLQKHVKYVRLWKILHINLDGNKHCSAQWV